MFSFQDQLERLDWRVRSGISSSAAILCGLMLYLACRFAVTGPWFLAAVAGVMAAMLVILARTSWEIRFPEKLKDKIEDAIGRWKEQKAKATKTLSGKVVWVAGRCILASWLASEFFALTEDLSPYVAAIATIGMGFSAGIWGIEAAIWSGVFVGLLAHFVMRMGLGVDLSDQATRNAYLTYWQAGSIHLSWLWPLGMAAVAPVWIGCAACVSLAKATVIGGYHHRLKTAADKKRIDDRRKRYQARSESGGNSALEVAKARYEQVQERLRGLTRGSEVLTAGTDGELMTGTALGADKEITGVEKLTNDEMAATLTRYATHIRHVQHSEKVGTAVDPILRRSFDRALQSSSDGFIAFLRRKDAGADEKMVLEYYNLLCSIEAQAVNVSGGDGEIVSTRETGEAALVEAPEPGPASPDEYAPAPTETYTDDDEGDALDGGNSFYRPAGRRFELAASQLPMMLAGSGDREVREGKDGTPEMAGLLPLANGKSDEGSNAMDRGALSGALAAAGLGMVDALDGDIEILQPGGSVSTSTESATSEETTVEDIGSDESREDAESPSNDTSVPTPTAEEDEGENSSSEASGDDHDQVGDEGGQPSPVGDDHKAVENVDHSPRSDAEMKRAAVLILQGQTDRPFVLENMDIFHDADALGATLGLEGSFVAEPFGAFALKVGAARAELALLKLLDSDGVALETVQDAVKNLLSMGWDHDPATLERANSWIEDAENAIRIENERLEEERRRVEAEEAERAARAEEDRLEALRIKREADEAAEVERIRALEEEERLAHRTALEANRHKYAARILLGKADDQTLVDGEELFPTVDDLAQALDIEPDDVKDQYEVFRQQCVARSKFIEIQAAYKEEDLNAVEALLATPDAFEGYMHPEIDIEGIRKWSEVMRERIQKSGLRDDTAIVPDAGGASRRLFMRKRLRISAELASVIEDELPKAMKLVKSLGQSIALLGGNAPVAMKDALQESKDWERSLAALVTQKVDGKDVAKEYVMSFLPGEVREREISAWDMLVRLAAGAEPASLAEVIATRNLKPEDEKGDVSEAGDDQVGPEQKEGYEITRPENPPIGDGNGLKRSLTFTSQRNLEDVQALNMEQELERLKNSIQKSDTQKIFSQIRISLDSQYGQNGGTRLEFNDTIGYISISNDDGEVVGKLKIECDGKTQPVWYDHKAECIVVYHDQKNKYGSFPMGPIVDSFRAIVQAPNGDPDTVIGYIRLSSAINSDGLTSLIPFLNKCGDRIRICAANDQSQIMSFMQEILKVA